MRVALIHGDPAPDNILIGPKGPVLIDAEFALNEGADDAGGHGRKRICAVTRLSLSAKRLLLT